jgi:hypothetical protein
MLALAQPQVVEPQLAAPLPSTIHTRWTVLKRIEHLKLSFIADYCTNLINHGMCSVCYHQPSPHRFTRHNAYNCPLGLTTPGTPYQNTFKPSIVFPPGTGCYLCGLPSGAPTFHPIHTANVPLDPFRCIWPDMTKPIAYLAWHDPILRARVFDRFNINPTSLEHYARWLSDYAENNTTLLNIHLVVFDIISCKSSLISQASR